MKVKKKSMSLQNILVDLLAPSGFKGTQDDILKALKGKGVPATQSTLSRALQKMGATKIYKENEPHYIIPETGPSLQKHVLSIASNESIIVLKTLPGAASYIAGIVDKEFHEETLGTIAGDDTVFVTPIRHKYVTKLKEKLDGAFLKK